jgi:thioredoxin-like negative regulator of GroEL
MGVSEAAGNKVLYREMLKIDPASSVFASFAEELCAAGEWEEAAQVCAKGLEHHPSHLRARVLLGWALWETGRAAEAEEVLRRAAEELRKNGTAFRILSKIALQSGDAGAAKHFSEIHESLTGDPKALSAAMETVPAPPVEAEAGTVSAEELLWGLLLRFEEMAAKPTAKDPDLFTDTERNLLREIIALGLMSDEPNPETSPAS